MNYFVNDKESGTTKQRNYKMAKEFAAIPASKRSVYKGGCMRSYTNNIPTYERLGKKVAHYL